MLLQVRQAVVRFANDIILDGADLRVEDREKVAIVGRNGAGKTTLLRAILGQYELESGSVTLGQGVQIGYLSQDSRLPEDATVLGAAEEARKHVIELREKLEALQKRLDNGATAEDLDEFTRLQEHFHGEGGYSIETDLTVVLKRMGFEESEFGKPVSALSGGERTRLILARLLLEEPDLLILDEPTNHLDLEATEWLESWIVGYHGAVLLISHDRTFLQNTAQRIVEIREGKTKSYPGGFEKYLVLRAEDEARQAEVARKQQQEMAKLDEYVRRFMNSQRTAQARGRLKQLEKLKSVAVEAPKNEKGIKGAFEVVRRSGDLVLEVAGLHHSFGAENFFHGLDWTVRWGERWGIIGQNGAGKSTLLRILLGKLDPTEGRVRLGSGVEIGYFSQDADSLIHELSPMMFLHEALGLDLGAARSLLGRFLISGDDATRPISTLSGGERNKVQLAALTATRPNVLVLDEPTNHLDMSSREALAEILREFNGTLLLVSHDRWLLGQVSDRTLDVRNSSVVQYPGGYEDYRRKQARSESAPVSQTQPAAQPTAPTMSPRELSKEIGRMEKLVALIEAQVSDQEQRLSAAESAMSSAAPDADHLALSLAYQSASDALEKTLQEWEAASSRLEELRAMQG